MMDAPLAASAHKENVHNRGKATVLMKPDKLKPVRTAGKERKALADLKNIYEPTFATSKDIDLKQKSAMKGNQAKSNAMTKVKERKAVPDRGAGHLTSIYTPEEIEDPLDIDGIGLDEYPLSGLKLKDD
ncbi:hypothetical protein MA16_Dca022018 [Dendrobium catenatum]|uniref:Uncharacterized protein n=1 Tax=Dendrobium catenatum TaxID=906689 RepID=A0A2I0X680_9ASPA|nr:hypothetical protein MA16_Dca022018 [Dendrobium catenatum]